MGTRQEPAAGDRKWPKLLILALFVGAIGAFFALGGQKYLTLDTIKSNRDALLDFTRDHRLAMIGIALLGVLALVPVAIKKLNAKRVPAT